MVTALKGKRRPGLIDRWKAHIASGMGFAKESKPLLTIFQRMADLALFTDDSQNGRVERGRVPLQPKLYWEAIRQRSPPVPPKTWGQSTDEEYVRLGGKFAPETGITVSERAFVKGYIPKELSAVLFDIINLDTDLLCAEEGLAGTSIPVTFEYNPISYNGPVLRMRPPLYTRHHMMMPNSETVQPEKFRGMGRVYIVDLKHGRSAKRHLFPKVLQCLEKAHEAMAREGVKIKLPA
jgi:hypothetical protein